jgi:hypothetical protein
MTLQKSINEAEGSESAQTDELARLKARVRELEASDPAIDHERDLNGSV